MDPKTPVVIERVDDESPLKGKVFKGDYLWIINGEHVQGLKNSQVNIDFCSSSPVLPPCRLQRWRVNQVTLLRGIHIAKNSFPKRRLFAAWNGTGFVVDSGRPSRLDAVPDNAVAHRQYSSRRTQGRGGDHRERSPR